MFNRLERNLKLKTDIIRQKYTRTGHGTPVRVVREEKNAL